MKSLRRILVAFSPRFPRFFRFVPTSKSEGGRLRSDKMWSHPSGNRALRGTGRCANIPPRNENPS